MNPDTDADRFTELLQGVGETYNQQVSPLRSTIYFGALQEFDVEVVSAAMMRHVQVSKFFPTPADIREIIEGNDTDREGIAWNALTIAIKRVGPYQSIVIEDPVVASAICLAFGSWPGACEARAQMHEAQWHSRRKDFGAAIRTARRDPSIRNGGPRLLTGTSDAQNRSSRAQWGDGQKITHALFGVIPLDGKVVSKRLTVNEQTLLPEMSFRQVVMLPAHDSLPLLTAGASTKIEPPIDPTYLELTPDQAREKFEREFAEMIERRGLKKKPIGMTDAEHSARVDELRRQSQFALEDSARGEDSQVHRTAEVAEPVSPAEATATGNPDRRADERREAAAVGNGVSVRDDDRQKVGVRSSVAGTDAGAGNRRRGVRQRSSRR